MITRGITALTLTLLGLMSAISAAPQSSQGVTDRQVSTWIHRALATDPRVTGSNIEVNTSGGFVTLSGTATNLAAKRYADLEAKKVRGVRGVIDEIEIRPTPRSDTDIRRDVTGRLATIPAVRPQDVQVTVEDGVVTLLGEVTGRDEAQEAELLASEARGVRGVKNDLRLRFRYRREDRDLEADALDALSRDVFLTGLPIAVSAEDGFVTLAGEVGNAYQGSRAVNRVLWVDGVRGVVNQLRVVPGEERGVREKQPLPSDEQVRDGVMAELQHDPRVDAAKVTVHVIDRRVTLEGAIPSYHQRRIADRDARNVVGVSRLTDTIEVVGPNRTDTAIQKDVQLLLDTDAALTKSDITVRVKNGIVTLKGRVSNGYQALHAQDLASRPEGVHKVIDKLKQDGGRAASDKQAQRWIRERLASDWITDWIEPQILVDVHNGVATLMGDVDNWSERIEAARIALASPGVWMVQNDLTVQGYPSPFDEWYWDGEYLYDPWFPGDGVY